MTRRERLELILMAPLYYPFFWALMAWMTLMMWWDERTEEAGRG